MDDQNLLLGIEEAKKGNYEKAAGYLVKAVQADPMNVDGWLFLGHCLSDADKRRYCYQRALAINPQNEIAKTSLTRLDNPQKVELPTPEHVSPPISQESPTTAPVNEQPSIIENKQKPGGLFGPFVFGFLLALLLLALPGILLVKSGKFDDYLLKKYLVPDIYPQMGSATPIPLRDQDNIDGYLANARQAINDKDYEKAIPYLDKVIKISPEHDAAYAMRAKCLYRLTYEEHSQDVYNANLQKALADIDMAISLQPSDAEYYALRRDVLSDISSSLTYQADREILLKSVIDNDRKFLSLSPILNRRLLFSTLLANDLIDAGQCEEGMEIVKGLEKKILPGDGDKYGCLMCAAAAGYACLGDMDKAVESMDEALSRSNNVLNARAYFKSLYLYQAGRKEEALATLNTSLNAYPTFVGNRYYLRALIDLDMGDKEQALQDLRMGEMYTWEREDLYAYVNAKLALEDGNTNDAIYWLQVAEASLFPYSSVLQKQMKEELLQLGAQPFEKLNSVEFQITPMPAVTAIP
jgi:tetratricopeptide (TPR) repeat protein